MVTAFEECTPDDALTAFLTSISGFYEGRRRKPNTVLFYRSGLRPFIGFLEANAIPLRSITLPKIERHLSERRECVSDATLYHDATAMRKFLEFCRRQGWIKRNPMRVPPSEGGIKLVKPPPPKPYVPSAEECQVFLDAVLSRWNPAVNPNARFTDDRNRKYRSRCDYCLFLLINETGCRISEACGLLRDDIKRLDSEWNHPTVTFRDTKTDSFRTVPVSSRWLASMTDYLLSRPKPIQADSPCLFITPYRTPITGHWACQKFKDYRRFAGLPEAFTSKAFRKIKATEYYSNGRIKEGTALLGHSAETGLKHYAAAKPENMLKVWQESENYRPIQKARPQRW